MCLGGGSVDPGPPQWLSRTDPPPGPPSPPDMVNDMEISDTGDFTRKNNLKINKQPAAQTTKSYGGAA
tara:strand:+ start:237 stop:440 length:204 start_codon:yes stop_codon:yes gene_type:complete